MLDTIPPSSEQHDAFAATLAFGNLEGFKDLMNLANPFLATPNAKESVIEIAVGLKETTFVQAAAEKFPEMLQQFPLIKKFLQQQTLVKQLTVPDTNFTSEEPLAREAHFSPPSARPSNRALLIEIDCQPKFDTETGALVFTHKAFNHNRQLLGTFSTYDHHQLSGSKDGPQYTIIDTTGVFDGMTANELGIDEFHHMCDNPPLSEQYWALVVGAAEHGAIRGGANVIHYAFSNSSYNNHATLAYLISYYGTCFIVDMMDRLSNPDDPNCTFEEAAMNSCVDIFNLALTNIVVSGINYGFNRLANWMGDKAQQAGFHEDVSYGIKFGPKIAKPLLPYIISSSNSFSTAYLSATFGAFAETAVTFFGKKCIDAVGNEQPKNKVSPEKQSVKSVYYK